VHCLNTLMKCSEDAVYAPADSDDGDTVGCRIPPDLGGCNIHPLNILITWAYELESQLDEVLGGFMFLGEEVRQI
jgi:hypothetical protein